MSLRRAAEEFSNRVISQRVAARYAAKVDWAEKGDKWVAKVEYASGEAHTWTLTKDGDKFSASVKTPKGTFKAKKSFDSLEQAQRFGKKFIDKANGHELLADALGKDFTK